MHRDVTANSTNSWCLYRAIQSPFSKSSLYLPVDRQERGLLKRFQNLFRFTTLNFGMTKKNGLHEETKHHKNVIPEIYGERSELSGISPFNK